ncbi:MAG: glycosyltransferase family protein [Burkholderiales bacterium]
MSLRADELRRIGEAARARVLREHTAMHRARELCELLEIRMHRTSARSACSEPAATA